MNSIESFAAEAAVFRNWARSGGDEGPAAARNALVRVSRLYSAALRLPPAWSKELEDQLEGQDEVEDVGQEELDTVRQAAARIPLQYYSVVFDPLQVPAEEPVVGDLADDLLDIYSDVVRGLMTYERGQRAEALWEWGFSFRIHWGDHATSAMRALHGWLAENEPVLLAAPVESR